MEYGHVFSLKNPDRQDLPEYASWLLDSDFGRLNFSTMEQTINLLQPGIDNGDITCVQNKHGESIGFAWSSRYGAFGRFPFLHMIAIKPSYRSIGAGSFLLEHVEESSFEVAAAVFTLTNGASPRLLRFFQRRDYRNIGKIPKHILSGFDETILMKVRD